MPDNPSKDYRAFLLTFTYITIIYFSLDMNEPWFGGLSTSTHHIDDLLPKSHAFPPDLLKSITDQRVHTVFEHTVLGVGGRVVVDRRRRLFAALCFADVFGASDGSRPGCLCARCS